MKKIILILFPLVILACSTSTEPTLVSSPGPNVTDVDGNVYQSVTIGDQLWIKQNLNVSKYSDGTAIPQVTDPTQWANLTTGAWCYYGNFTVHGPIYGKLYNWYAVMGIYDAASASNPSLRKKLAPSGWHIPTDSEWIQLTDFLGGEAIAGGKMKVTSSFPAGPGTWQSPNVGATNESQFTAVPGGICQVDAKSAGMDLFGLWWSSSEFDSSNAWYRMLFTGNGCAYKLSNSKKLGLSVRCIKD